MSNIIIGILGYKQSGKDTVASLFANCFPNHSYVRLGFADPLKAEIAILTGGDIATINQNKNLPGMRWILQHYGTDYARANYPNHWVDCWLRSYEFFTKGTERDWLIVVPDLRFPNEQDMLANLGAHFVKVTRPGCEADEHPSEKLISSLYYEREIYNDQTIKHLEYQVKKIADYICKHPKSNTQEELTQKHPTSI